jgi:hypothetical protein
MDAVITQILQISFSYVILFIVLVFGLNWLKRGELFAFMKVRASRGGKTLAIIHAVNDVYYKAGVFEQNAFKYKDRAGKDCLLVAVPPNAIYSTMGVQAIDIDEVNACIWTREGAILQGNDPVHVDYLVKRALESPQEQSLLFKIVVICLILLILAVIADTVFIVQIKNMLAQTTLAHVIPAGGA